MNLEKSLEGLRSEAVPADALELTVAALRKKRRNPGRRIWLASTALTSAAILAALWPSSKTDEVWANAIKALKEARYTHIQLFKKWEHIEAWKAGGKVRRVGTIDEVRYNGSKVSERYGFLFSVRSSKKAPFLLDLNAFNAAERAIETKTAKPERVSLGGKPYQAYRFHFSDVYDGPPSFNTKADREARYPNNHHMGIIEVTAYVDAGVGRIVRLEQKLKFDPKVPQSRRGGSETESFDATVEYPSSLPDSMFDPPADAFDYAGSKNQVAKLLKGSLGEQTVAGQKVSLKALLCDGINLYAIWSGCAGDYNGPRFKVDGVDLGPINSHVQSVVRCLSSAKCLRPSSAKCAFAAIGEAVPRRTPDHLDLVLPVFAEDSMRPYRDQRGKIVGYHSRKVGDAEFLRVPVTPIKPLDWYEKELGLSKAMW